MSIKLEHIYYTYSPGTTYEIQALKDINLEISDGQFVGLIGHTGSGKSTLVSHLNGLTRATKGNLYYNGAAVYGADYPLKELRQHVGLVFQYPEHQLFETTVLKDVCFGPKNMKLSLQEQERRAKEALKLVGMDDSCYDSSPFELSGGQKRRVAIAGVLAMEPEVLVLDEPTAGLDPKGRDEILALISELHEKKHMTIILVSHSMEDVAKYVNRVLVMDDGRVFFDGTPKEVFAHRTELEKMGLALPQVTYLMQALKERGLDVNTDAITVEEACRDILRGIKKKMEGDLSC